MMIVDGKPHTGRFGRTDSDGCPTCLSRDCLHRGYSAKLLRFIGRHADVYSAAYTHPGNASNQLERLDREYRTLPPRHACTCNPGHCRECARIDRQRPLYGDVAPAVGRTNRAGPTTPTPTLLDISMARAAGRTGPADVAAFLSGQNRQDASK